MTQLVFFLEEPSAREMLKGLLPNLLPKSVIPCYVVFEGKQDLERQLPRKLRGWRRPNSVFVVLRDKDAGNCGQIKANLLDICQKANKPNALVRIACHELESWYLGDLRAVEQGLGIGGLAKRQGSQKYREPDLLTKPSQELMRVTNKRYQKMAGSRKIGPYLSLDINRSHSFNMFVSGIGRLVGDTGR